MGKIEANPGSLSVSFVGDPIIVRDRLSFGRNADLELDDNVHLHRLVGEFVLRDGAWWVDNLGSRLFLSVVSSNGTRVDLAPGGTQLIGPEPGTVRVVVGQARYEMSYSPPNATEARVDSARIPSGATTEFQAILTPREVDFLVTFAAPILDARDEPIPTYATVAELWSVSPKTLDNTLQSIKRKLRNARLVRHEPLDGLLRAVVSHSLISRSDLDWAQLEAGAPRTSADGPRFAQ